MKIRILLLLLQIALYILYLISIIWHMNHPYRSILTGNMNHIKRWYIDENSLDPVHFHMDHMFPLIPNQSVQINKNNDDYDHDLLELLKSSSSSSSCQILRRLQYRQRHDDTDRINNRVHIPCHTYHTSSNPSSSFNHNSTNSLLLSYDIIKIIPKSIAVSPTSECTVFVIPWNIQQYQNYEIYHQYYLLYMIQQLSTVPWLSKTIL